MAMKREQRETTRQQQMTASASTNVAPLPDLNSFEDLTNQVEKVDDQDLFQDLTEELKDLEI